MSLAEKQGNRNSESNLLKISLGANNESQNETKYLERGEGQQTRQRIVVSERRQSYNHST